MVHCHGRGRGFGPILVWHRLAGESDFSQNPQAVADGEEGRVEPSDFQLVA